MFMTLIHFDFNSRNVSNNYRFLSHDLNWPFWHTQLIYIIFGLPMIMMVAVGYKTKLVSVTLIFALFIHNIRYNNFWRHRNGGVEPSKPKISCKIGLLTTNSFYTINKARKPTFSISRNLTSSRPYPSLAVSFNSLYMDRAACQLMTA